MEPLKGGNGGSIKEINKRRDLREHGRTGGREEGRRR
jgi:hypothetical protein